MAVTAPVKRVPERTCVICRTKAAKRGLVRIVRSDGVEIDVTGKKPGRGAYLCGRRACWEAALKREDRFEKALRTKLTAGDRQKLEEYARNLGDE